MRLVLIALIALAGIASRQNPPVSQIQATPIVVLDKTRFVLGERVFFWVGVSTSNSYVIPAALQSTCQLHITRPDGTTRTDVMGWPIDGMGVNEPGDRGWRGGHGLGTEPQQVGRYTLVFEFAGKKSEPKTFTIEDVGLLRGISAAFEFPSPFLLTATDAAVVLTVKNTLTDSILFPHRGEMFESVSVTLEKTTGTPWGSSFFVSEEALIRAAGLKKSRIAEDVLNRRFLSSVNIVTLAPGESYKLRIPVRDLVAGQSDGIAGIPSGEFDVQLHTQIQVLIGSSAGIWKDFEPLRISVQGTAKARRE